jgi:pilus assembly protein CpaE
LRVCLFNETESEKDAFRAPFEGTENLSLGESFWAWAQLREALLRNEYDVAVVALDSPDALGVVGKITQQAPECRVIGVSANTDATFIIKAMRAGCDQFVCSPVDDEDLNNALERVRPTITRGSQPSKRICVVGSSGGAGATTVACNLAMELAKQNAQKVAIVDLNLEYGDVACAFDCSPKYTIADLCTEDSEFDVDTLRAVLHDLPCDVSIIARPNDVDASRDVTPDGVRTMLQMLGELFPYVIVDLPRQYNFVSAVAVGRSDHVLITTQMGVPFIRNSKRIFDVLMQLGTNPDSVHYILNRYNAEFERINLQDVESHLKRPIFAKIPNDYQYVSAALDLGHPIGADAPTSKCRTAIVEMAKRLSPGRESDELETKSSRGFLGKLLGRK